MYSIYCTVYNVLYMGKDDLNLNTFDNAAFETINRGLKNRIEQEKEMEVN